LSAEYHRKKTKNLAKPISVELGNNKAIIASQEVIFLYHRAREAMSAFPWGEGEGS